MPNRSAKIHPKGNPHTLLVISSFTTYKMLFECGHASCTEVLCNGILQPYHFRKNKKRDFAFQKRSIQCNFIIVWKYYKNIWVDWWWWWCYRSEVSVRLIANHIKINWILYVCACVYIDFFYKNSFIVKRMLNSHQLLMLVRESLL